MKRVGVIIEVLIVSLLCVGVAAEKKAELPAYDETIMPMALEV